MKFSILTIVLLGLLPLQERRSQDGARRPIDTDWQDTARAHGYLPADERLVTYDVSDLCTMGAASGGDVAQAREESLRELVQVVRDTITPTSLGNKVAGMGDEKVR